MLVDARSLCLVMMALGHATLIAATNSEVVTENRSNDRDSRALRISHVANRAVNIPAINQCGRIK